jgi:hypothetical protein
MTADGVADIDAQLARAARPRQAGVVSPAGRLEW